LKPSGVSSDKKRPRAPGQTGLPKITRVAGTAEMRIDAFDFKGWDKKKSGRYGFG